MAVGSSKVSIEALLENEIQEISYDGTEKTVAPLTSSDSLSKNAQMIDFGKNELNSARQKHDSKKETATTKAWPWEWLRDQLVATQTEMNVLSDVLQIAKQKKYMVLDPIQNERTEPRSAYQLVSHKMALVNAGEILMKGANNLKFVQQEIQSKCQQSDFHSELWQLRQNWRIKKVGQHIIGDLSYKTAGSYFWQSGAFEVFKKTNVTPGSSSIDVKLPLELEGSAYIQVTIHMTTAEDSVTKLNSMLTIPQEVPTSPSETSRWQSKLEAAQNVLFCKELFSQISREAFQLDASIPHMVANNQVIVHLFPEFKMHIMFCHSDTEDKTAEGVHPLADQTLQLALHQLLREQHYSSLHREPPHPVSASIGPSKMRRMAGPAGFSAHELLEIDPPDANNILKKMVAIGRHTVLRLRVTETVEHMALTVSDPLIQIHTDGLSDELHTALRITITSPSYDQIKQSFLIRISGGAVIAVGKGGHEFHFSHESQQMEDYLLWQIAQYQMEAVSKLAKLMGCNVLASSASSVSPHLEVMGTNPSILLSSPDGSRAISVRANTVSGVEVHVSKSGEPLDHIKGLITEQKWTLLRGGFTKVNLEKMAGRNFTHKMEFVLAVFSGRVEGNIC